MNNVDLIVATLRAAGVRRGFGIPTGHLESDEARAPPAHHFGVTGHCCKTRRRFARRPRLMIEDMIEGLWAWL